MPGLISPLRQARIALNQRLARQEISEAAYHDEMSALERQDRAERLARAAARAAAQIKPRGQ